MNDDWKKTVESTTRMALDRTVIGNLHSLPIRETPIPTPPTRLYRHPSKVDPGLRILLSEMVRGKHPWPLYLYGKVGRGKTCAALSLCDWIDRSCYRTVTNLCDAMAARKDCPWDWQYSPALAVLDELGIREWENRLAYDAVKRFCDWREQRSNGIAIYVSNLSPERFAKLDDRISSRVLAGTWFELEGPDRRRTRQVKHD